MISYSPFWATLRASDETTYSLIRKHGFSSSTIDKLRKNKPITTTTINDLCSVFNCTVDAILEYIPNEEDQRRHTVK